MPPKQKVTEKTKPKSNTTGTATQAVTLPNWPVLKPVLSATDLTIEETLKDPRWGSEDIDLDPLPACRHLPPLQLAASPVRLPAPLEDWLDGPLSPLPAHYLSPDSSPTLSVLALDDPPDDGGSAEGWTTPLQATAECTTRRTASSAGTAFSSLLRSMRRGL